MSTAPVYPRRRYNAPRKPSTITDADLRHHGLPPTPSKPPATPPAKARSTAADALNPRLWRVIERVADRADGTRKSTRILPVRGGVLVNTCTRGSAGMSEALVFVPGATAADFPV